MTQVSTSVRGAVPVASKLFLVFQVGGQRFALAAMEVAQILPLLPLKPVPRAPAWVAGIFAHRGHVVPVIDIGALTFDQPAVARTSTRLVLVHYRVQPQQPDALLGLILEQATDTLRCDPAEFQPYGLDNPAAPYLGPVREDALGLLQWVRVEDLLDDQARAMLYAPSLAVGLHEEGPR